MFGEQASAPFSQRWALINLTVSIFLSSSRYHTSASFEHPVHLTIVTLLLTGLFLAGVARWRPKHGPSLAVFQDPDSAQAAHRTSGALRHKTTAVKILWFILDRARRLHTSFYLLVTCIVVRTWLHEAITRTSQCSCRGLEASFSHHPSSMRWYFTAFLPFLALVLEAIGPLGISPPDFQPHDVGQSSRLPRLSWPSRSHLAYTLVSLSWPALVILVLDPSHFTTGTVCVGSQWEAFVPHMQLLKCGLDAIIITHSAHLVRDAADDELDALNFMGALSLTAGCCVLFLSLPGWLTYPEIPMGGLHYADARDLVIDGVLLSSGLVCATVLLSVLHSSPFSLFITSLGFMGSRSDQLGATAYLSPSYFSEAVEYTALVLLGTVPLWYLARHLPNVSKSFVHPSLYKWLLTAYATVVSLGAICWLWTSIKAGPSDFSLDVVVEKMVSDAGAGAGRWETQAARSKTLVDAVAEYRRRYGISPPPNFDKWYEFAIEHKSPVIDDFGQIHDDLLPFWSQEPASIRDKTSRLLSSTDMGGLRIRNGTLAGAHHPMLDGVEKMVGPFSQWLPDMDLALNLADGCRMAIPFEDMQRLKERAQRNRALAGAAKDVTDGWTTAELSKSPEGGGDKGMDRFFTDAARTPIFYDWIAPTCDPRSKARTSRWWDWAMTCAGCMKPHSVETSSGPLVDDMSRALDLCHQPDVAYLDGSILSPPRALLTRDLLPIFSPGRIGGFSDILFPLPPQRTESGDHTDWGSKANTMFWRGPRPDDSAAARGFLRPRLVHEAHQHAAAPGPGINVSFAAAPPEEHWRYRHLVVDGAGQSGGLAAFLGSGSLAYRVGLVRTWHEERLRAWHHYVPVDVRLGSGFWAALGFLGSERRGGETAERVARQGREWARRALREEDMQVYMFRLLLEWGRIVDDGREGLGFAG